MQKGQQQQQGYSLFPGQIVAVEGMNGTGRKITATKLREGALLPPASSSSRAIRKYYYDGDDVTNMNTNAAQTAPLKVISACGPFTTAKSMDYAPFVDLMHVVLEEKPDVVILTGPFVDLRQEAVQSGRVTVDDVDNEEQEQEIVVDYETVFAQRIAGLIEEVLMEQVDDEKSGGDISTSLQTEFVLVPALEDATAKWV